MNLDDSGRVTDLPNGGLVVKTKLGALQFGIPPETIKDSLKLKLEVPTMFVLYGEIFDRRMGVNMGEFEFPAYFNFFIKGQKVKLIIHPELETVIRTVFQETLLGPLTYDFRSDFAEHIPSSWYPDIPAEGIWLDGNRADLTVDSLIDFIPFDSEGLVDLGEGVKLRCVKSQGQIEVVEDEEVICAAPMGVSLPADLISSHSISSKSIQGLGMTTDFTPPLFGVTMIGTSHGFDPCGRTTGFILWMRGRGCFIDPPPQSADILLNMGIAPTLVDSIILTHCHADHDAGTFQKILQSRMIKIITTNTIMQSFVRKYSAISQFSEEFIGSLFEHIPAVIGEELPFHGGSLTFHYNLHTIPTIGFVAHYTKKTIAYSGDTCYDPELLKKMMDKGTITKERYDQMMNFPFDSDLVLHEAGVPPIHTAASTLAALPEEVRKNMLLVHTAQKNCPENMEVAKEGETVTLEVERDDDGSSEVISLLEDSDIYASLVATEDRRERLLAKVKRVIYPANTVLLETGMVPTKCMIIGKGVVKEKDECESTYIVGDSIADATLIKGAASTVEAVCVTRVEMIEIEADDFKALLEGTGIVELVTRNYDVFRQLDFQHHSTFQKSSVLRHLSSSNRMGLELAMAILHFNEGEVLWTTDDPATFAFLVHSGNVRVLAPKPQLQDDHQQADSYKYKRRSSLDIKEMCEGTFGPGSWIGDTEALMNETAVKSRVVAHTNCTILAVSREDVVMFYSKAPGILLGLLGKVAVGPAPEATQ
eukprot:GFYU01007679.1.p1 GENE.GFYU01007679.1~~GFYU01007679.1.p1  ORF type:complete len:762 (+),score=245.08 GFYU01007679.1:403-2688(+)